jgi:DNA-binding transcriptional LysR family regulator
MTNPLEQTLVRSPGGPASSDAAIELRHWRQFLTLAQTLHFGHAAERLHMTQPPLTLAIQLLERRLGVVLFERTRRSVELTAAGAAMVEPVRDLLAQASAVQRRAHDVAAGEAGRLRLGFVSTVGYGPLPLWLRAFRQACPGVAIELIEATGDVQLKAFEHGELDAGFLLHAPGRVPAPSGDVTPLQRLSLGVEPLVLALPDAPPWCVGQRLSVSRILREPLVIFPRAAAPSLYDEVLAFYHGLHVTPDIAQEATQMQTIVNLVSAGLGLALVPRAVTPLRRPGVIYRALPKALGAVAPQCETTLLWRTDAAPAVERFAALVAQLLGAAPVATRLGYRSR